MNQLYIKYGFPSLSKFWEIVKDEGYKYKDVKEFIEQQKEDQVHKLVRKRKGFITAFNGDYMADLLDMSTYSGSNKGYKWILIIVNLFTRQGYAYPLKNKKPNELVKAFNLTNVKVLYTDNGNEFKGAFGLMMKDNNIIHITNIVGDHKALGIIDNFSKRVKNALHKWFSHTGKTKWIDYIDIFIENYNKTPHSGILDLKPNDVMRRDNRYFIGTLNDNKRKVNNKNFNRLSIGDTVRTKKRRRQFDKGYIPRWSGEVFKVVDIDGDIMILNDGRKFKSKNLLAVRGGDEVDMNELEEVKKVKKSKVKMARYGVGDGEIRKGKRERKRRKEKNIIFY